MRSFQIANQIHSPLFFINVVLFPLESVLLLNVVTNVSVVRCNRQRVSTDDEIALVRVAQQSARNLPVFYVVV